MGLWGVTTAAGDKPKFLPIDKNAAGSTGSREHAIAVKGGWGLAPGLAASGNDNPNAQPEVLVCVKNLAEAMGSASIIGMDWSDGEVADTPGTSFKPLALISFSSILNPPIVP